MKLATCAGLATATMLGLQSCVAPAERAFQDPLDHTPSGMVHDPAECACLARLKLVTDPIFRTPCLSDLNARGCAFRIDCSAPEAPAGLRQAVLSCAANP